jgi:hypothetical protein
VHKVMTVSQSKSGNVWIYNTLCTGYTWSLLTLAWHVMRVEKGGRGVAKREA